MDWALSKNQMAATSKGSAEKGEDEQIAAGHDSHSDIEGERQEGKRLKQGDHRKIGLVVSGRLSGTLPSNTVVD